MHIIIIIHVIKLILMLLSNAITGCVVINFGDFIFSPKAKLLGFFGYRIFHMFIL